MTKNKDVVLDYTISVPCLECHNRFDIQVNKQDFDRYMENKEPIQKTFWYLSDNERELLISRMCGVCYDHMFDKATKTVN